MNNILTINEHSFKREFSPEFDIIAKALLNEFQLITPEHKYWIREIEFYYYSEKHTDYYSHKNNRQLTNSNFYFHRFKNPDKYERLMQKGIDITCGDNKNKRYGGILIRCIENVLTNDTHTGIGKITNLIMEELGGAQKIPEIYLVENAAFNPSSILRLGKAQNNNFKIFKKHRQGLNLKREDSDRFFIDASYNYFTYPQIIELK